MFQIIDELAMLTDYSCEMVELDEVMEAFITKLFYFICWHTAELGVTHWFMWLLKSFTFLPSSFASSTPVDLLV